MPELTERILRDYGTIAVVGLSANPAKAAHSVPAAMQSAGFRVIPVHPSADEILGERAYRSLGEIPEPIDLVNVFRPAAEAPGIAREAAGAGAKALWLQLGIVSDDAREIAQGAGLQYVENRCIAVERARFGVRKG